MLKKDSVGRLGEDLACRFLEKKGFLVLERNYRKPWGEIDIIASKGGVLTFIEVKAVSYEGREGYRPEENVYKGKLKRLSRIVETYLSHRAYEKEWRFAVVAIDIEAKTKTARIRFLDDALEG